jgi:glucose dehydrogenase
VVDGVLYNGKIFVGTGNSSPWSHFIRSPGGGDNLYLSSILALDPASGEIVWHYQETPGDTWDYTATQQIILADLSIDGKPRKVILNALDKNFRYTPGATNAGTDLSVLTDFPRDQAKASLLAWDPVAQKERWRVPYDHPWNGGTLTTAGNLVFQGTAGGC